MMSDHDVIVNLAIGHLEDEGEWLLCTADECQVGVDDD